MKKLFQEVIGWTVVPLIVAYFFLWGGATFPSAWYQNRGAEMAILNCWLGLGVAVLVAAFCMAFVLDVFNVRHPWSIASLVVSSVYGVVSYGGALLVMYGVTPFWYRLAQDLGFFAIAATACVIFAVIHGWKSMMYTAG